MKQNEYFKPTALEINLEWREYKKNWYTVFHHKGHVRYTQNLNYERSSLGLKILKFIVNLAYKIFL